MKVPTNFPKWNVAVDGLEDAGKWAMEIERSRLPPDSMLPRQGQVWEAVVDCEVIFRGCFCNSPKPGTPEFLFLQSLIHATPAELIPFSGFGTARLQRGERVRILEAGPRPIRVSFTPLRYDELHESLVLEEVRRHPCYSGYILRLKTARTISDLCTIGGRRFASFVEAFHLMEDAASNSE
jgi:hypothetical protein